MEESKHRCYLIQGKNKFRCKLCGRIRSSKQRILTHLVDFHNKSPMKRVYMKYKDNPSIAVPKRTLYRHAAMAAHLESEATDVNSDIVGQSLSQESTSAENPEDELNESGSSNEVEHTSVSYTYDTSSNYVSDLSDINCDSDESTDSDVESMSASSNSYSDSEVSSSELSDESDEMLDRDTVVDTTVEDGPIYPESEIQRLCIMSCILRHNMSGSASKDMLQLMRILCPDSDNLKKMSYQDIMAASGDADIMTVHYCSICGGQFPEQPDEYLCSTEGCPGYRYKGPLSSQRKENRQPRSCFVLADVKRQLKYILEKKGNWNSVQMIKESIRQNNLPDEMTDIVDGQYYRSLCEKGNFLHDMNNVSAVFNTDGIPLYSSSNVKLWPVFLAINELPPATRFARENMILAAIWQGKNKPPFTQYLGAFSEAMVKLHDEGLVITPPGAPTPITVRMGVYLGTMDLQAKAYVLNMTMHNGQYGCSTCEEPGETVRQGKGYARTYPYRSPEQQPTIRDSHDVIYEKGTEATPAKRINGICGMTGLALMPWFDVVIGIVPDYMHGVLMGVVKTLMYKFFSLTNSNEDYFVGKHLKQISRRLLGMCPPDYIERMPRDLEKHYSHFKATELQSWLLYYCIPCLNGFLKDVYLRHLSLLCEGIHLLLGDSISEPELQRAEFLLDSFYKQYADLYKEGSCGLNVHNIGAHIVFYVRMWGPLWAWSCFPFEDWNAAVLQSVHGTGDVKKQILQMRENELKLSCVDLSRLQACKGKSYLKKMKQRGKFWTSYGKDISISGCLRTVSDLPAEHCQCILEATGLLDMTFVKKAFRVKLNDNKLYSKEYTRMTKRVCYMVRCKNGDMRKIEYFIVNVLTDHIYAFGKVVLVSDNCFICDGPRHIIRIEDTSNLVCFPVEEIAEKLFFMQVDGMKYVACMPNLVGHGILK
ncbi:uncharacterized protein [Ptychodera flava]|uniref:uncharacterized protein n=1 Tax=Ptychodera flava TaxID=63121 RepID=UPI00396A1478